MKGTIVNIITVIAGSFIGILIGSKFPEKIKKIAFDGVGLSSLTLGVMLALKTDNIIIMVFSVLFGGIIGEFLRIEEFLESIGDKIKRKIKTQSSFTEGFITATLVFCVGSMAIIGSINEGLTGDATILYTKSILDGITSIALSSTLGIGVMFSTLPILLYQGGITLFSSLIRNFFTTHTINMITGVGGVLIIGIGLNLLGIKKIKLANFLPALIIAFILSIFIK
ncbi:MAG: DUF554 domain-containing protein [Caldisericia bacterium]